MLWLLIGFTLAGIFYACKGTGVDKAINDYVATDHENRLDQPDGPEIGALDLQPTEAPGKNITNWKEQTVKIKLLQGKHTLYAVAASFRRIWLEITI